MDWDEYAKTYRQVERAPSIPSLVSRVMRGRSGTAVDVGCGEGDLLDRLTAEFPTWDVTGFEVSEFRGELARQRGHSVLVDEAGTVPGTYDLALSQHVIEHVASDREHVLRLAEAVFPGGHVYVETPLKLRGAWYFRRNPQAGWVLDPTHVREYRRVADLVRVMESAGLVTEAVAVDPLRFPVEAAVALLGRVTHLRLGFGRAMRWSVPIPRYRVVGVLARRPS